MLVLALVFLVVLVAPLVVDLPAAARTAFSAADLAIWPAFAVDYGVRLYLAPARWHFVRTHPLDLIVLALPMLRPLRALRLLRPARLGAIAGVAHRRAQRSLHATVAGYVTTSAAGVLVLAAAVMYDVERRAPAGNIKSFPDALWWAVTTVTTVGYGDRYPTTGAGRLVGGALMLVGIALLGVVTASIAAWFVGRLRDVEVAEQSTQATLAEILAVLPALHARAGRPGATSSAQRLRRHGPPGRRLASRWRETGEAGRGAAAAAPRRLFHPEPGGRTAQPAVAAVADARDGVCAVPALVGCSTGAVVQLASGRPVAHADSCGRADRDRGAGAASGDQFRRAVPPAGRARWRPARRRVHARDRQPGRHPGHHRLDDLPRRLHRHHPPAGVLHQCAQAPADRRLRLSRHGSARLREDHLIALELGGAPSDQRNVWPEPAHSPNPKDKVENVLCQRVCAGSLTLAEAQQRIATDWTTAAR